MKYGLLALIWMMWCFFHSALIAMRVTGYFIVGTLLEERKLSIEFPEAYKEYQQRVSMFFPYRWINSKWNP